MFVRVHLLGDRATTSLIKKRGGAGGKRTRAPSVLSSGEKWVWQKDCRNEAAAGIQLGVRDNLQGRKRKAFGV